MKSITKTSMVLLVALMLSSVSVFAQKKGTANNGYSKQKVVYHVNNLQTAKAALRNVKNHLNALGDKNIEIRVVTHSSGAFVLVEGTQDKKGHSFNDQVASLAGRGVKFYICNNTIRGKKIDESKINLHAKRVPSGVAEVAELQQKGFVYLKP